MESALMMVPPSLSASANASADLPLVVGPAKRTAWMAWEAVTGLSRPPLGAKSTWHPRVRWH
jgi:hypothetical protein